MQRTEQGLVIISCDFCGTDWDEVIPMIEGHRGSILCLECLKVALDALVDTGEKKLDCTMCLQPVAEAKRHWKPARDTAVTLPPGGNAHAVLCESCMNQAAGTYSKDPDVDWKRPSPASRTGA
ncbi:MAG: hypothetical protein WD768_19150 [Phycisphaeraceae bacterium]